MLPAPVPPIFALIFVAYALIGTGAALVWFIVFLLEPRCRASFQRHRRGQILLAAVLLLPSLLLLGLTLAVWLFEL